jgi:hypothetical protein
MTYALRRDIPFKPVLERLSVYEMLPLLSSSNARPPGSCALKTDESQCNEVLRG